MSSEKSLKKLKFIEPWEKEKIGVNTLIAERAAMISKSPRDGREIKRVISSVGRDFSFDDEGKITHHVIVTFPQDLRTSVYELDSQEAFETDREAGEISFTSKKVRYKIRAIQESDSDWVFYAPGTEQKAEG